MKKGTFDMKEITVGDLKEIYDYEFQLMKDLLKDRQNILMEKLFSKNSSKVVDK